MPRPEHDPELAHLDAAGWVLGVLDLQDAARFAEHLRSCPDCQAAVDELRPSAGLLQTAAPAALPPPDLRARTLDRMRQAAQPGAGVQWAAAPPGPAIAQGSASGQPRPAAQPAKQAWWRAWKWRVLVPATAAVLAAAAIGTDLLVTQPAAVAAAIPLHQAAGQYASGQYLSGRAVVHRSGSGWSIQLTVQGLRDLGPGRFYECWYSGPGSRPGHPNLITAGTFTVGPSGNATVQMWSAANPEIYRTMQITAESSGDGAQHGQVVLTGTATS